MNDRFDPKHTTVCILIYGGGILLTVAFWRGVYAVLRTAGLVPWQAGVETAILMALEVAVVARVVDGR